MTDPTATKILAATLWILMTSPVWWQVWKMWVNHRYYKRFHQKHEDAIADPDPRRRIERFLAIGGPNPPY